MWRTMHKLTRTFADQAQPKRSAELYKMKLNEFKEHVPLLNTFCNHGLRDRHWQRVSWPKCDVRISHWLRVCVIVEQMSDVVGFELKPGPETPLSTILGYNLHKHLEK